MAKPCTGALAPEQVCHEHVEWIWIENGLLTWCINIYIIPRGCLVVPCSHGLNIVDNVAVQSSLRTLGLWPCSRVFRSFIVFFRQDSGHRFSFLSVSFFLFISSFFFLLFSVNAINNPLFIRLSVILLEQFSNGFNRNRFRSSRQARQSVDSHAVKFVSGFQAFKFHSGQYSIETKQLASLQVDQRWRRSIFKLWQCEQPLFRRKIGKLQKRNRSNSVFWQTHRCR